MVYTASNMLLLAYHIHISTTIVAYTQIDGMDALSVTFQEFIRIMQLNISC